MKPKFTVGLGVILILLVLAAYASACGPDWIVPTEPAFPLPPGCWQVEDPVTVINSTTTVEVTAIQCPTSPTDPTSPVDPPTNPPTDAGNPPGDPSDGGQPTDDDTFVRYNPRNGKCYKLHGSQMDSNGKHRGWVVVSEDEVNCPTIQGQH